MREDEVLAQLTTPLAAPAFPRGPYRFTDREYLNITYRTDPAALRALVPEPLALDEPLVRFEVMRMPDVTGLGDYTEAGQVAMVRHGEEAGEFTLGMYVDSLPAIASGREVGAYPKKLGQPRLYTDSDTLVGTLAYGSIQVALATMGYKHRVLDEEQARAELTAPTFMLKIVPGYDGKPRICELARSRISDVTIKGAWTGPARLHLVPHALAPLADLPVLEIVSASHLLTDLTLGRTAAVHDYLA